MQPVRDLFSPLNTAQSYIRSGLVKTALVIGAEKMSRIVDWKDRGTCILFGDGAGAVVLRGEESESAEAVYTAMHIRQETRERH